MGFNSGFKGLNICKMISKPDRPYRRLIVSAPRTRSRPDHTAL